MSRRSALRIAALSAAVLFAVLGGSSPGGAFDGSGCPTDPNWTGGKKCSFFVKGFPIVFHGAVTEAPVGSNSIRIWVTPAGNPEVVLWECRKTGLRYPSCDGGFPDSSTQTQDVPWPAAAAKPSLDCYVQGTGKGTYYCQSGSG